MSEDEINKIIAEYMGTIKLIKKCQEMDSPTMILTTYKEFPSYTSSLDALVPVVEKIGVIYYEMCDQGVHGYICNFWHVNIVSSGKSPSIALATACAEAIKELNAPKEDK